MKLYSVKFNETFNNGKDHISIEDAFSRFHPTILLEWKHSLEPRIKATKEVKYCGRPEGRKIREVTVPGNPNLDAGGKKVTQRWAFWDQYFIRMVLL